MYFFSIKIHEFTMPGANVQAMVLMTMEYALLHLCKYGSPVVTVYLGELARTLNWVKGFFTPGGNTIYLIPNEDKGIVYIVSRPDHPLVSAVRQHFEEDIETGEEWQQLVFKGTLSEAEALFEQKD